MTDKMPSKLVQFKIFAGSFVLTLLVSISAAPGFGTIIWSPPVQISPPSDSVNVSFSIGLEADGSGTIDSIRNAIVNNTNPSPIYIPITDFSTGYTSANQPLTFVGNNVPSEVDLSISLFTVHANFFPNDGLASEFFTPSWSGSYSYLAYVANPSGLEGYGRLFLPQYGNPTSYPRYCWQNVGTFTYRSPSSMAFNRSTGLTYNNALIKYFSYQGAEICYGSGVQSMDFKFTILGNRRNYSVSDLFKKSVWASTIGSTVNQPYGGWPNISDSKFASLFPGMIRSSTTLKLPIQPYFKFFIKLTTHTVITSIPTYVTLSADSFLNANNVSVSFFYVSGPAPKDEKDIPNLDGQSPIIPPVDLDKLPVSLGGFTLGNLFYKKFEPPLELAVDTSNGYLVGQFTVRTDNSTEKSSYFLPKDRFGCSEILDGASASTVPADTFVPPTSQNSLMALITALGSKLSVIMAPK